MKAYITRYALTSGVTFASGMLWEGYFDPDGNGLVQLISPKYFHKTAQDAILRCEEMRIAKIKSLKKQIAKLEALDFEAVVRKAGE